MLEETEPVKEEHISDLQPELEYSELMYSESNDEERSLLIRYALRAEILSIQLNNVLQLFQQQINSTYI